MFHHLWQVLNSPQRNLPNMYSPRTLRKGNEHGVSSSHWFAIFSALIVQDCLLLGLLFLVKQMQKLLHSLWQMFEIPSCHCQFPPPAMEAETYSAKPVTGPLLLQLLPRHAESISCSSVMWGDLSSVYMLSFIISVCALSPCLLGDSITCPWGQPEKIWLTGIILKICPLFQQSSFIIRPSFYVRAALPWRKAISSFSCKSEFLLLHPLGSCFHSLPDLLGESTQALMENPATLSHAARRSFLEDFSFEKEEGKESTVKW